MEWSSEYSPLQLQLHPVEMLQKHSPSSLSFLGGRTLAPRPLSEATEIFDTDSEEEFDSLPDSPGDDDSQSTLSSRDEIPTPPHTGGLGGFEFHFDDKAVVGPQGPHLFRGSPDILSSPDEDAFLSLSPAAAPKPPPPKPIVALNTAVAELDESQVRDWTPRQVADWMSEAGFEVSVVEKFLIHDISGSVLLDLQFEDLKELDISSFGKRHRVMSSIHQLRNSSMISLESPLSRSLSRSPSKSNRSPRALQRAPRPEESQVVVSDRSRSRRRARQSDVVTPAESISIVGIEQVLPKEHKCSKGEDCAKWQKQQRKIMRVQRAFDEDARRPISEVPSEALPSVVGSSDVLGPSSVKITAETLSGLQPRDAQESVRQFLNFQHVHPPSHTSSPSPSAQSASASSSSKQVQPQQPPNTPKSAHLAEHLRGLPKLTIPMSPKLEESPSRTPISALQQPTQIQAQLKAQLRRDPYHYGGVASPADIYRVETPMSAMDLRDITTMMVDPCERDVSQSVPPEMRYGAAPIFITPEPIQRCVSTQPPPPPPAPRRHMRQQSFTPSVAPVKENEAQASNTMTCSYDHHFRSTSRGARVTEIDLANHQGWMRKRKTTRMLRHEWQDNYCTLVGNQLTMHETHYANATPVENIDVGEYILHAYSQASSSKLSAAFKKSLLGQGKLPGGEHSFAFSLVPDTDRAASRRMFEKAGKGHHFAVDSSKERIEWMRKLMLAKAMKKNDVCQI